MKVQVALAAGFLILSASAGALQASQALKQMQPGVPYVMNSDVARDLGIDFEKVTQALGTESIVVALDQQREQFEVSILNPDLSSDLSSGAKVKKLSF